MAGLLRAPTLSSGWEGGALGPWAAQQLRDGRVRTTVLAPGEPGQLLWGTGPADGDLQVPAQGCGMGGQQAAVGDSAREGPTWPSGSPLKSLGFKSRLSTSRGSFFSL